MNCKIYYKSFYFHSIGNTLWNLYCNSIMHFNFDPKDNDPRNTLGKKLKKVIVNSMF